jgi:hypothetical protein
MVTDPTAFVALCVSTGVDRSVPLKLTLPVAAVAPPPLGTEALCSVPEMDIDPVHAAPPL